MSWISHTIIPHIVMSVSHFSQSRRWTVWIRVIVIFIFMYIQADRHIIKQYIGDLYIHISIEEINFYFIKSLSVVNGDIMPNIIPKSSLRFKWIFSATFVNMTVPQIQQICFLRPNQSAEDTSAIVWRLCCTRFAKYDTLNERSTVHVLLNEN